MKILTKQCNAILFVIVPTCSGKGSRAILKKQKQGVLVHDASYNGVVQLEGPEASICEKYCIFMWFFVEERQNARECK